MVLGVLLPWGVCVRGESSGDVTSGGQGWWVPWPGLGLTRRGWKMPFLNWTLGPQPGCPHPAGLQPLPGVWQHVYPP